MHQKLVPGSFFILVNNPKQPLPAINSFKNKIFWKGILKNSWKSKYSFSLNYFPFNEQSYQKQKGPRTSDQSLFRLQNKFTNNSLLVMYYLTKFDGAI